MAAGAYAVISAAPYDTAVVTNAALNALAHEYTAAQASDASALAGLFTGHALELEAPMRDQVQQDIANGEDYPGVVELSNPTVQHVQGSSSSVVLDVLVHEKLANMRAGAVVDYSQSDIVYHLTLVKIGNQWLVSEMDWKFAPGGGP